LPGDVEPFISEAAEMPPAAELELAVETGIAFL
jgi:hypothetical protein